MYKEDAFDSMKGLSGEIDELRKIAPPDNIITSDVLIGLRNGDHESYKKVYLHWRRPIYKFVNNLTGSDMEADDLTQDIFATLWRYREKVDPEKNIHSLLFYMARRMVSNSRRSQQVRDKYAKSVWFDESDLFTSHDMVVEQEAELLKRALLNRMPSQQRRIFEMAHDEGLTTDEIATRLGVKRETIYNQLSKARKEIRDAVLMFLIVFAGSSDAAVRQIIDSIFS